MNVQYKVEQQFKRNNYIRLFKIFNEYNYFLMSVVFFLVNLFLSYVVPAKVAQGLQLISILFIFYFGIKRASYVIENTYFKYMFFLFMLSSMFAVFRMNLPDYYHLKIFLFSDYAFWPYFIPLVVFIKRTPQLFKVIFNWIFRLAILFFILSILLWNVFKSYTNIGEQAIWIFSSGCGFLLLNSKYQSFSRNIIAMCAILLALYISTALARRNVMLTNINFVVFTFILYFFFLKGHATKKLLSIYASVIVLSICFYFFQSKIDTDFKTIANRATEDTREYVFLYFFDDMKDHVWLGKGIDGTYFCPLTTEDEEVIYRDVIECGYLQIFFKAGLINLILFLLILVPAIYLGIFSSRNIFSKACGMLIFLWLVDMIPYGLPNFSLRYILVWICVGVCFDKKIRNFSENEIELFLEKL